MRLSNRVIKLYLFLILICWASCSGFAQNNCPFLGEIISDNINVRTDATISSETICKVRKGEFVVVLKEFYEWYKIRLPKTAPAFVHKSLASSQDNSTAIILKDNVNVRLRPNDSSPILGRLKTNDTIEILYTQGQWFRIAPANNTCGWIHKKFVKQGSVTNQPPKQASEQEVTKLDQQGPQESLEQKTQQPQPEEDKEDPLTIVGTLKPCTKLFTRLASHKIVTSDKKTFLLKGNKKFLNTFNNYKVRVEGRIIRDAKEQYPVIETKKIEVLD